MSEDLYRSVLRITEQMEQASLVRVFLSILRNIPKVESVELHDIVRNEDPVAGFQDPEAVTGALAGTGPSETESLSFYNAETDDTAVAPVDPDHDRDRMVEAVRSGRGIHVNSSDGSGCTRYLLVMNSIVPKQILVVRFKEKEEATIWRVGYLLKIYRNQAQLLRSSDLDPLTGLQNRQCFDRRLQKILHRMSHNRGTGDFYYFVLFDIDHFKRINDEHGHLIGDEVLVRFAALMEGSFRFDDMPFRYGGEEFGLILCSEDPVQIGRILDRFRTRIREFLFPAKLRLSFSAGFVRIRPSDLSVDVVEKADRALYYAKENGRDRICDYDELIEHGSLRPVEYGSEDVVLWKKGKANGKGTAKRESGTE